MNWRTDKKCPHYGTMTLTPTEDDGWRVLDWCFYQRKAIEDGCQKDCPYKDKPVYEGE